MLGKLSYLVLAVLLCCCIAGAARAADIVTVPTANMVGAGNIDVAAYYIWVDESGLIAPIRHLGINDVRVQTLYAGLTDRWELDLERFDVDLPDDVNGVETIANLNYLALPETAKNPAVVVGGWDLSDQYGHASWYLCTAKTLEPAGRRAAHRPHLPPASQLRNRDGLDLRGAAASRGVRRPAGAGQAHLPADRRGRHVGRPGPHHRAVLYAQLHSGPPSRSAPTALTRGPA